MSRLGGFAGIVRVQVPVETSRSCLQALAARDSP